MASYASGALLGSLGISAFGTRLPPARTMVLACVAWFLCLLGLALPIGLLAAGPIVTAIGFRGLVLIYVGLGLSLLAAIALVWRDDLLPHAAPANALR